MSRPWREALKLGEEGERLASKLLPELFPNARIRRVQPTHQRWLHSDFLVEVGSTRLFIETKYDLARTGNLAIETKLEYPSGKVVPGWLYRTKADYVLYLLSNFDEAYLLPTDELRLLIELRRSDLTEKSTCVQGTKAYFYLLPREQVPFRKLRYGPGRQDAKRHPRELQAVGVG